MDTKDNNLNADCCGPGALSRLVESSYRPQEVKQIKDKLRRLAIEVESLDEQLDAYMEGVDGRLDEIEERLEGLTELNRELDWDSERKTREDGKRR